MSHVTRADSSDRGGGVLRGLVLLLAVVLAGAATATLVLTDDPKTLRLAVVGALWAFLLGAVTIPRRGRAASSGAPAPAAGAAGTGSGSELELRRTYEVELEREVAARREYEMQLEVYLRRELEQGLREEVTALRDELGRLRGEMLDRLDGDMHVQRIETRLYAGSLPALRDEPQHADGADGNLVEPGYGQTALGWPQPANGTLPAAAGPGESLPPLDPVWPPNGPPAWYDDDGSGIGPVGSPKPPVIPSASNSWAFTETGSHRLLPDDRTRGPGGPVALPPPGVAALPEPRREPDPYLPAYPYRAGPEDAARPAAAGAGSYRPTSDPAPGGGGAASAQPPRDQHPDDTGARRRRRARNDDEPNEVLARLLGRS